MTMQVLTHDYVLNYYPHDGVHDEQGVIDWSKVERVEIGLVDFVRERTCKIESSYYYDDYDLYEFEFSCGHSVNMYDKEPTSYCPICGCKVVGE